MFFIYYCWSKTLQEKSKLKKISKLDAGNKNSKDYKVKAI